jgi:regulatory protein
LKKKPDITLRVRAMRALARREYSRAELRARLLLHAGEADDVDALLDTLAARGWLSDARALEQTVNNRRTRFGPQRIAHELKQKGISDDLIRAVLPQLKQGELEAAREVWQKKFSAPPQDQKEKARQMRFLQARGFSVDVIMRVMKASSEIEEEA